MSRVDPANTPSVSVTELPEEAALIDVREDDEWAAGHAPDAVHIPLGELPQRLAELPDGELYLVCRSGGRSGQAAAYLTANGRSAINVAGGMQSWASAGKRMVGERGDTPPAVL
ncbi:MAG: rhodanese-like domain-containing protein [Sciscionella sp.]